MGHPLGDMCYRPKMESRARYIESLLVWEHLTIFYPCRAKLTEVENSFNCPIVATTGSSATTWSASWSRTFISPFVSFGNRQYLPAPPVHGAFQGIRLKRRTKNGQDSLC